MSDGEPAKKVVKIAELKNRLSHYLRRVQRGESILIADRDRIVARIERAGSDAAPEDSDTKWLERLERRGVLRRGRGQITRQWLNKRLRVDADVVDAIIRDREDSP